MTTTPRAMRRWITFVRTSGPEGEGWLLPRFAAAPWEQFLPEAWGISDETDLGWALARLSPTPFGRFKDAVRCRNPLAETLPRTYIRCLRWPHPSFDAMRRRPGAPKAGVVTSWTRDTFVMSPIRAISSSVCSRSAPRIKDEAHLLARPRCRTQPRAREASRHAGRLALVERAAISKTAPTD